MINIFDGAVSTELDKQFIKWQKNSIHFKFCNFYIGFIFSDMEISSQL